MPGPTAVVAVAGVPLTDAMVFVVLRTPLVGLATVHAVQVPVELVTVFATVAVPAGSGRTVTV